MKKCGNKKGVGGLTTRREKIIFIQKQKHG
jgi:hypothetical protein